LEAAADYLHNKMNWRHYKDISRLLCSFNLKRLQAY